MVRRVFFVPALIVVLQLAAFAETSISVQWRKPEAAAASAGRAALDSRDQSGPANAVAVDPVGDTFGVGPVLHDIVQFSATRSLPDLILSARFVGSISPGDSGSPNALVGYFDIDTDQNAATGGAGFVSIFCPAPPPIGPEYYVDLFSYSSATGRANLVSSSAGVVGQVLVIFQGQSLSIRIPLAVLSDDGIVDTATVLGTIREPTDCAPDGTGAALTSDPLPIPTLGEWGILLMGALLLGLGVYRLRNQPFSGKIS